LKALRVALFASMGPLLTSVALAQSSEAAARSILPPSAPAGAAAPTFRHRALVGFAFGSFDVSTQLNGQSVAENYSDQGGGGTFGFESGLEERFTRLLSLAARARFFTADTYWAQAVGYQRTRWDLGLEPRLWVRLPRARRIEGYLGLGSGVALASEKPPPRRAYDERIEGHPGYYLSVCLGATHSWENFALFTEFGYAFHATHIEATLEPRAPGVPRTIEDRDYLDHSLLFSLGIVAGFGELD